MAWWLRNCTVVVITKQRYIQYILGPFIRGKIRRELYHLYQHVLSNKTRLQRRTQLQRYKLLSNMVSGVGDWVTRSQISLLMEARQSLFVQLQISCWGNYCHRSISDCLGDIDCKIRNKIRIVKSMIWGGGHLFKCKFIIYGKTSVLTKDYEDANQVQVDCRLFDKYRYCNDVYSKYWFFTCMIMPQMTSCWEYLINKWGWVSYKEL